MKLVKPISNRGVALLTAMLISALVSLVALNLLTRQQLEIRRTANVLDYDQALLYALGMESWAVQILVRDREKNTIDHLGEDWASHIPPLPVEGGEVMGELQDQQGLYNVNNLLNGEAIDPAEFERFQRLLVALELPPELAEGVVDWLDPDQEPRFSGGAEDQDYLLAQPPYRAANSWLRSRSELRLIKGFTPEVYRRLAPYVTALPDRTPVNVNTAPLPVMMSLIPGLSMEDAQNLVEARGGNGGYQDISSFQNQPKIIGQIQFLSQGTGISVSSRWFLAHGLTHIGRLTLDLYSLLLRDQGKAISVLRAQGTW